MFDFLKNNVGMNTCHCDCILYNECNLDNSNGLICTKNHINYFINMLSNENLGYHEMMNFLKYSNKYNFDKTTLFKSISKKKINYQDLLYIIKMDFLNYGSILNFINFFVFVINKKLRNIILTKILMNFESNISIDKLNLIDYIFDYLKSNIYNKSISFLNEENFNALLNYMLYICKFVNKIDVVEEIIEIMKKANFTFDDSNNGLKSIITSIIYCYMGEDILQDIGIKIKCNKKKDRIELIENMNHINYNYISLLKFKKIEMIN